MPCYTVKIFKQAFLLNFFTILDNRIAVAIKQFLTHLSLFFCTFLVLKPISKYQMRCPRPLLWCQAIAIFKLSLFYYYVILLWALELWLFEFDWFWCHFQTCSNLFPWQFWVQEAKFKGQNSWSRLFLWFLAKNIIKFDHPELVFSHFGGAKWRNFNQTEKKPLFWT